MVPFDIYTASEILKPLVFLLLGMVIYAIFIFHFYKFISRKDIFALNLSQYNQAKHPLLEKILGVILYLVEYILLFPLFTFFWFLILTILLSFMVKEPVVQSLLLISIALVGVVRITAYYKEELAKEVAKVLPFTLLGIYLADTAYFSFKESWAILKQFPSQLNIIIYYLIFIILLEFVLRISYLIFNPSKAETPQDQIEKIG